MARSRSNSRNTNGSQSAHIPPSGNGRNGAASHPRAPSVRSAGDLRDHLTNNRNGGSAPAASLPAPPPQEGWAAIQQAAIALTRLVEGLHGGPQAAPPGPGAPRGVPTPPPTHPRERGEPGSRHPRAQRTQVEGEVNSPRPSERQGGGDAPRARQECREPGKEHSARSKSALARLSTRVPARDRLSMRAPAEESAAPKSTSRRPRHQPRQEQAFRAERSGETNGGAPSPHRDEVERLRRRMDELQKKIDEKDGSPEPQDVLATPFAGAIMEEPFPKDFRFPTIKTYSGTSDPRAHLNRYRAAMMMTGASDAIMCRGFFSTLDGQAQDWFGSLPEGSISTFAALTKQFMSYFASNVQKRKEFADLYHVKQRPADSLPEFLNKWKREVLGVANFDDKAAIIIFRNNLRSGPFYRDLIRYPP